MLSLSSLSLDTLQRQWELSHHFEIRDRAIYFDKIISGDLSQAHQPDNFTLTSPRLLSCKKVWNFRQGSFPSSLVFRSMQLCAMLLEELIIIVVHPVLILLAHYVGKAISAIGTSVLLLGWDIQKLNTTLAKYYIMNSLWLRLPNP